MTIMSNLLDRKAVKIEIERNFGAQLDLISEMVDYYDELLEKLIETNSLAKLEDTVLIGTFGHQALMMLDGVGVLVREGQINAAMLQVRTLFEIKLNLKWMLLQDTTQRARHFWTWKLRQERNKEAMQCVGTLEHEKIKASMPSAAAIPSEISEEARKKIEKLDEQLSNDFGDENAAFHKARGGKDYDVNWYYLSLGSNSIHRLAKELDKLEEISPLADYQVFYGPFSNITHGHAMELCFCNRDGFLKRFPIRSPEYRSTVFAYSVYQAYFIFLALCKPYSSEKTNELTSIWQGWLGRWEKVEARTRSPAESRLSS